MEFGVWDLEFSSEPHPPHRREHRQQQRQHELEDVAEKAWRPRAGVLGDALDHEVRAVADVGACAPKHRADAEGDQIVIVGGDETAGVGDVLAGEQTDGRREEAEVGRRVVEHGGEQAAAPVKLAGRGDAEFGGVQLQPVERRRHRREDAGEQKRHLFQRREVEVVGLVHRFAGGEIRAGRRCDHQRLAQ